MSGQKKSFKAYSSMTASAVLAASMVLGGAGAAFAADTTTVAATTTTTQTSTTAAAAAGTFGDVKSGAWYEKHVYKLAAQGIVIGNNGLFRPGDSVTQQEAVLMALRFMKLQDKASNATGVVLPTNFQVNNYYKNYVILAFQQGLLDKTTEMAADNLKTSWGDRKASREWIAQLLVRALGKSADAAAVASEPTGFADDEKVSANKRGYVNAAVDLGLANGLDGNRFDPQGAVTRAQLATFFSRAEAQTTTVYDNSVSGIVTSLKDGKLSVYNNVSTAVYTLGAGTGYFTSASDSKITLADLKLYTKVTVIGSSGNAVYVEVTDPTVQAESKEGVFAKLTSGVIWLDSSNGYDQYSYDANTEFVDVNGNAITASSITAGSKLTLLRETYSGAHKVLKVQVTSGVVNKTATGTIQAIDLTAKTITFKNADGTVETFKWEDGSSLFSSQNAKLLPSELKVNYGVKYTIKNNLILSVEVTSAVERTVQGTITELTSSSVVYKKTDGTKEAKVLAANPVIAISGITAPALTDLVADATGGDIVQLTLNSSDQVTKIEVLSRQIEQYAGAVISSYTSKTQLLTFTDSSGKPHVVLLDSNTKLLFDGTTAVTLASLSTRLYENVRVNVVSIGQRTLSLELTTKYSGTLSAVNTTSRTISIKLSSGQTVTLPMPAVIDLYGKSGATIADIALNTPVTAMLTSSQDSISVLKAASAVQLLVTSVNSSNGKIVVSGASGSTEFYASGVPITNEAGQTLTVTDLKAGDYINVKFDGSNPSAIQIVKVTLGQVTAVDANAGTLTVKDYAGAVQTISVSSSGVRIIRDGVTSTGLAGLTAGDRADVRKDADGVITVRVLTKASRTLSRIDDGVLTVKRANLTENNQFPMANNVYIHQGDTTLPVQSLKENDNIMLYFNNNVVIEVVKQ
ncbi:S-layer homology domain-containing protein [Paenibacillus sp. NFR01]|uniref:S-layer homology domain-containing protein n=1 Tax=Paenibacillus sp. NFR01 TaxID=1566279 RepID=UPI0008B6B606|nr:S-layer homology domain-containing protein [Paenibacillus sp. NFR01]SET50343.1 S-layer homology domain-containing protein [Paenibacillus sp. NFR01]